MMYHVVEYMHIDSNIRSKHRRTQVQKTHDAKTNVSRLNFEVGEFFVSEALQERPQVLPKIKGADESDCGQNPAWRSESGASLLQVRWSSILNACFHIRYCSAVNRTLPS